MENPSPREQIALCLIVGNEPKRLDRCLTHFAPAVSELCVVHAHGNTPADIEVARVCQKHGAKLGVYANDPKNDWPHVDDFGAARQQSFDLATKPWALWVDADDVPGDNFAPALHELFTKFAADFDAFALYHDVAGRGIAHNLRERLVRRDRGQWINKIHENFQLAPDAKIARCDAPVVVHLPDDEPKQGSNRNLTILESIPEADRTLSEIYHLHGEYMAAGRKNDAMLMAKKALAHPRLEPTERYELCLNIAEMARPDIIETGTPEHAAMMTALHSAYRTAPNRREALALLGALHLDLGDMVAAEAYLRSMMALPRPIEKVWTHRDGLYGWAGETLWTQLLRMTGRTAEADAIETARLAAQTAPTISLIQPVTAAPEQAARIRKLFLDSSKNAERIEHIFGLPEDNADLNILLRFRHATDPATTATGQILVEIHDQTAPPLHWDQRIVEAIEGDTAAAATVLSLRYQLR